MNLNTRANEPLTSDSNSEEQIILQPHSSSDTTSKSKPRQTSIHGCIDHDKNYSDTESEVNEDTVQPHINPKILDWRDAAMDKIEHTRYWIRENPAPAIGIAVAAGFVVGRVFRR